jgi:hypothetical protein
MFNIYSYKVDPLVPAFDLNTGKPNEYFEVPGEDGKMIKIHYMSTSESNGTDIIIEVPKHKKSEYIDAINQQLMYFSEIKLNEYTEGVLQTSNPVAAKIFYEDEHIILSENNIYTRPHIVMGGVNYNDIDFQELEIETREGNVGIKVAQEDVEVTPSRESVIWSEKTRETILHKISLAKDIARNTIQSNLTNETDYFSWVLKVKQVLSRRSDNNENGAQILGRLSGLINRNDLIFTFNNDEDLRYESGQLLAGHAIRYVSRHITKDGKVVIKRSDADKHASSFDPQRTYFKSEKTSNKKDTHLLTIHPEGFYILEPDISAEHAEALLDENTSLRTLVSKRTLKIIDLVSKSVAIKQYSDIVPPDSLKEYSEADDAEVVELTAEQKRELENRIVVKRLTMYNHQNFHSLESVYEEQKDLMIQTLTNSKNPIVYGVKEDKELLANFLSILQITNEWFDENKDTRLELHVGVTEFEKETFVTGEKWNSTHNSNKGTEIMLVSKDNVKYLAPLEHTIYAKNLLYNVENNTIKCHAMIRDWYTAYLVNEYFNQIDFINNVHVLSIEVQETVKELQEFVRRHGGNASITSSFKDNVTSYLQKLTDLQVFVDENNDEHAIALKSKELFDDDKITGAQAVNLDIFRKLQFIQEYLKPVEMLLNDVNAIKGEYDSKIDLTLVKELRHYAHSKNVKLN